MTQLEPYDLKHQFLLEPIWKGLCQKHNLLFAEYSFANNYLFRNIHDYQVVWDEHPLVLGKFKEGKRYLIPTMAPEELVLKARAWIERWNCCLFPIPDEWLSYFPKDTFTFSFDPGDSDYIYSMNKMSTLRGRHLSSRRNLLHQLEKTHQVSSKPLTPADVPDAFEVLEYWKRSKISDEENDYQACIDALNHLEHLGLFGRIAYENHRPIGFTVGELINLSVAVLHLAKTRLDIKGTTPFLYRDFAQHLPQTVDWINLEQDLGSPSLRQAKYAYNPDYLKTKWRVNLLG